MRRRKSLIQVAPSNDRSPIIQEYFDWPPIRDPSENQQALFNDTTDRPGARLTTVWPVMTEKESTVELVGRTRNNSLRSSPGAIAKILGESCTKFVSLQRGSLCLRQMHNDREWFIGRKLSRPSDDEFLYIVVEILFAVRRIQTMPHSDCASCAGYCRCRGRTAQSRGIPRAESDFRPASPHRPGRGRIALQPSALQDGP